MPIVIENESSIVFFFVKKIVFPNYNDNVTTKFCIENVRVAYANQCRLMRSVCGTRYFKIGCYELFFVLITRTH